MTKYVLVFGATFLLIGCQQPTLNTVSYKYATCKSKNNVGIKFHDGIYKCFYKKGDKVVYSKPKIIKKVKSISKECETTVTKIYTKQDLTVCAGKLLQDGQKTRIVRVNK